MKHSSYPLISSDSFVCVTPHTFSSPRAAPVISTLYLGLPSMVRYNSVISAEAHA